MFRMILEIIPSNIISPFYEKNSMQIVFIAVIIGLSALILNKKTKLFSQLVEQLQFIVQLIMEFVSSLVPVAIALSVVRMIMMKSYLSMANMGALFWFITAAVVIYTAFQLVTAAAACKVSAVTLLKKLAPSFLIALSTASSSAAFASSIETCENKLGINKRLVHFGVPVGTVTFKPSYAVMLLLASVCTAWRCGMEISAVWLCSALFAALFLSIACPPVRGAGVACYTIMFLCLEIPLDTITVIFVLDAIFEYPTTAVDVSSLQLQLLLCAKRIGMVDLDKLRKREKTGKNGGVG